MNDIQGWINLYKPKNISSFQAINKIKKKFKFNKIGHAGTLDPMAEGILPIAIGKTTKLISFINLNLKIYEFNISWGSQTTTDDSKGDIIYSSNLIPKKTEIISKIKNLKGEIKQYPPKVSAVKINGERAYKLQRDNIAFETKPKNVYLNYVKIIKNFKKETKFEIESGKGFYVRSFARDLSHDLGTYGHISYLKRSKVGKFTEDKSILLDDLMKIVQRRSLINCIQSSISMLDDILAYEIHDMKDLKNLSLGNTIEIDVKKINKTFSNTSMDEKLIFLSKKGDIISVGKLVGNLFKPNKVLI